MAWTPDRVDTLTKMWSEGESASQIANALGEVTRNAVIGKVHRLGLSNRGSTNIKEKNTTKLRTKAPKLKNQTQTTDTSHISSILINKKKGPSKQTESKADTENIEKPSLARPGKSIIFSQNRPLPPQPSTSEISEETLKNVRSLEKKSKKLSLMELTERTCKWPIGDPATEEFWFCGHTAEQGKPYCETHIEIAFQPVVSRRERRSR